MFHEFWKSFKKQKHFASFATVLQISQHDQKMGEGASKNLQKFTFQEFFAILCNNHRLE